MKVKEGRKQDATIIERSRGRAREGSTNTRDASFTKKHGRTHHGIKDGIRGG